MANLIDVLLLPEVLAPLAGVVGGVLGYFIKRGLDYWLGKRRLRMEHSYRVIEEHTKKLHEYAEKYYLKTISNLRFLQNQLCNIEKLSESNLPIEEELELSFFGLARLTKLEEEWFRKVSGILLLRDPTGEMVLTTLHAKVEEQFFGKDGYLNMEDDAQIREEIDSDERFSRFKTKLKQGRLEGIASKYKAAVRKNISSLRSVVRSLRCLHILFDFELNACYEAWYGKKAMKPCFEPEEWSLLNDTLDELQEHKKIHLKDKKSYWKRIKGN